MSAAEVAHATLVEHCSEAQRAALPRVLNVVGRSGYTYVIEVQAGTAVMRSPDGPWGIVIATRKISGLPGADCALAGKLLIEADEAAFLAAARKCGTVWLD